ncbi:amidohydrolase family protein [Candidatus Fermentibacteria bacterium]|nr:amidohydrolase family protein [Candidatus Fermentibacteria bacterium]
MVRAPFPVLRSVRAESSTNAGRNVDVNLRLGREGSSTGLRVCYISPCGRLTTPRGKDRMELSVRAVLTPKEGLRDGGWLLRVENGALAGISPAASQGPYRDCVAVPGLIQSHLHLCQTVMRGMAENRALLPWLRRRIWPLEASLDEETMAASVILSLRELLSSGCTGLMDMGAVENTGVIVDLLVRSGIRALVGNTLMDRGPEYIARPQGWLREETARIRSACRGRVGYAWAPRFALSCSDRLWAWVESERGDRPLATHCAETGEELRQPEVDAAGGNVRFLAERGALKGRTLLAHCVHLRPGEADILASSSTAVVHCPWANLRLGSGIADVPDLSSREIDVLLGSDGAACGNSLDLADVCRLAAGLAALKPKGLRIAGSFWLSSCTERAARAMGWARVGRLEKGWQADLALIEPREQEWDELERAEDPTRYLLELSWPARNRLTMVGGDVLYRNSSFPTLTDASVDLLHLRAELWKRARILVPGFDGTP